MIGILALWIVVDIGEFNKIAHNRKVNCANLDHRPYINLHPKVDGLS